MFIHFLLEETRLGDSHPMRIVSSYHWQSRQYPEKCCLFSPRESTVPSGFPQRFHSKTPAYGSVARGFLRKTAFKTLYKKSPTT